MNYAKPSLPSGPPHHIDQTCATVWVMIIILLGLLGFAFVRLLVKLGG